MRRFLFDNFDAAEPEPDEQFVAEAEEATEVDAEPPPLYGEEDLAAARDSAYGDGYEAGRKATLASVEAEARHSLQSLESQLAALHADERDAAEGRRELACDVALAMMRRMLPELSRRNALVEIEACIREVMDDLVDEPRLVIRVHDTMLDPVRDRLESALTTSPFSGRMVFVTDDALGPGDCRIEWADGGAERRVERIQADMTDIVHRILAAESLKRGGHPVSGNERDDALPAEAGRVPRVNQDESANASESQSRAVPPAASGANAVATETDATSAGGAHTTDATEPQTANPSTARSSRTAAPLAAGGQA